MSETPLKRYRLNEVIRQFMDFRGRTPLKLGMEWGEGNICALSANNVQMGCIDFSKEGYLGSEALYRCWMTKGDCKKGDILLTTEAPLGNVAQIPDDNKYILSQRTILLKADNSSVLSDYLFHLFQSESFQSDLVRHSTGSTVVGIQQTKLAKIEIQLPTLVKQKKIAKILSTIDQTIAHTEALIQKYQQIKTGLMHDLFTRGITSDGKLRPPREQAPELYQETAIGWIPREWDIIPLHKLSEMSSGGTPKRNEMSYWDGDIPWIKTGEIQYNIITKTEEYISQDGLKFSSAKLFPAGTIIMAIYGEGNTRGRVAKLGINSTTNQACVAFFFNNLVVNDFMYYLFEKDYLRIRDTSNDGSQKNLSATLLKGFECPVPKKISEQSKIAKKLSAIDKQIANENTLRDKLRKQKSGLMHDLLTGKVSITISES